MQKFKIMNYVDMRFQNDSSNNKVRFTLTTCELFLVQSKN